MNNKINFFHIIFFFLILLLTACEDKKDNDAEVEVIFHRATIDVPNAGISTVYYDYSVKNIGTSTVNGWRVSFTVLFDGQPQATVTDNTYNILEPNEESKIQKGRSFIFGIFESAKITNLSLKNINTW